MTGIGDTRTDAEIEELCQLLLGMDRARLLRILDRLEDRGKFTEYQSQTLGAAMRMAMKRDKAFADSMGLMINTGVHATVERDAPAFGLALAPAMGPAIRNAVRLAMQGFITSLETVVDQRLSVRSIRWRLEAWRSGCTFAEVVFRHTLLYRVEHVFLVHSKGGVQLLHASPPDVIAREPDLISAMLTAIQDFARDAFAAPVGDTLTSFAVGDLVVGVESGSHCVLAAVVRGKAPPQLRVQLRESLDSIESAMGPQLTQFNGDVDEFEAVRPYVEGCLLKSELPAAARGAKAKKKKSVVSWVLLGAVVLALVWLTVRWFDEAAVEGRFASFLGELRQEPGIVVTEVETTESGWMVRGLRDPLSREPDGIAAGHRVGSLVEYDMQPYLAVHPEFLLQRVTRALRPPSGVTVELQGDRLVLGGKADHTWCERARSIAAAFPGVAEVVDEALEDTDETAWRGAATELRAGQKPLSALRQGFGAEIRWLTDLARSLDRHGRPLDRDGALRCTVVVPASGSLPLAETEGRALVAELRAVLPLRVQLGAPVVDAAVSAPQVRFDVSER